MANPSYLALSTMRGKILYSGQLATTTATNIYTVPASTTCKLATGTVCNIGASACTVNVSLHKVGDTADGTHRVVSGYSLAPGDTLSLKDYIAGAMLAEGESVNVTAGTGAVLDVVLTGAESV